MTVIAWDGHTLAADKRAGTGLPRTITKIFRAKNGNLVGLTGSAARDAELFDWYERGAEPRDYPKFHEDQDKASCMLVIERGTKRVLWYLGAAIPAVFEDKLQAVGCGRDFAMMAMHLGKNAEDAVRLTCELCADCGNGVDTLTLEPVTSLGLSVVR